MFWSIVSAGISSARWIADFRGHTRNGAVGRNGLHHDAAGGDLAIGADLDIAENLGAGADHDAAADLRMPVAASLPVPPSVTFLQDGDLVFDDRRFADDDAEP